MMLKRPRGLSLIEVLIASAMMLMLLLAFYAAAESLQRSQITSDARQSARQALRSGIRAFTIATSEATCFYSGATATPINIGGYSCLLPSRAPSGTDFVAGDTVAVAVPVDLSRPVNPADDPASSSTALFPSSSSSATPDGFHDNRYNIVVLTTRPTTPVDSRNPNSRQLVVMRWEDRAPVSYGAPLTINLATLGNPVSERVFDCHLRPLTSDGFRVNYRARGSVAAASTIKAEFDFKPLQGSNQSEKYEYLFNTRNIF
jgi:prepilin-type N-terminal cleavage/methylation domain-containing protein